MDDDYPHAAQVEKLVLMLLVFFVGFDLKDEDRIGFHRQNEAPGLKHWVSGQIDKSEGYQLSVEEEEAGFETGPLVADQFDVVVSCPNFLLHLRVVQLVVAPLEVPTEDVRGQESDRHEGVVRDITVVASPRDPLSL